MREELNFQHLPGQYARKQRLIFWEILIGIKKNQLMRIIFRCRILSQKDHSSPSLGNLTNEENRPLSETFLLLSCLEADE